MKQVLIIIVGLLISLTASAFPLDAYQDTGIRRLDHDRLVQLGEQRGYRLAEGALLNSNQVEPSLSWMVAPSIPAIDKTFSRQLRGLIAKKQQRNYALALLDLSDEDNPRLATHNFNYKTNAGSVGKLLLAATVFNELARHWPDNTYQRADVLRDSLITANNWANGDKHKVTLWNPRNGKKQKRPLQAGDSGNLWEFLDWMVSASSNAAASIVGQQVILLRHFGRDYDPASPEALHFLKTAKARQMNSLFQAAMSDTVETIGLSSQDFYQGSLFTRSAKNRMGGQRSRATLRSLLEFMYHMEYGTLIDEFSSDSMKKLMYLTEKRIRYAAHPYLSEAAMYFKSGSMYGCKDRSKPCPKYKGDRLNRLASVALIEYPANKPQFRYIAVVMSDVLEVNSAVAHQTLAWKIHKLVRDTQPADSGYMSQHLTP